MSRQEAQLAMEEACGLGSLLLLRARPARVFLGHRPIKANTRGRGVT